MCNNIIYIPDIQNRWKSQNESIWTKKKDFLKGQLRNLNYVIAYVKTVHSSSKKLQFIFIACSLDIDSVITGEIIIRGWVWWKS